MLHADYAYAKTDKGRAEILQRQHGLAPRARTVLIQLDGRTPLRLLLERNAVNPHFVDDVALLHAQGYITAVHPDGTVERARATAGGKADPRDTLVDLAEQLLGKHAPPIVARIQKCGDRPEDLSACIEACQKLIRLTIDEAKAEQFARQAHAVAGHR